MTLPAPPLVRPAGRPDAARMLDRTLQGMARGGVYDQLGGGFHRYSVDARVDRAALREDVVRQLRAAQGLPATPMPLFGTEEYAATARGIVRWVREVLADPARRLRRQPGRRRRARRRRRLLHLDPRRGRRGADARRARGGRRLLRHRHRRRDAPQSRPRTCCSSRPRRFGDRDSGGRTEHDVRALLDARPGQAAGGARGTRRRRSWTAPATPTGTR